MINRFLVTVISLA